MADHLASLFHAGADAGRLVVGLGDRLLRLCGLWGCRLALPGGGSLVLGSGERGRGGQANAARSRWKPSAIWVAQLQVRSLRSRTCRADRVMGAFLA